MRFRVLAGLSGVSLLGDFAWCVSALGRLCRPSGVSPLVSPLVPCCRRRVRVVCPRLVAGLNGVSPPWGDFGVCSFLGVSCVVRRIVAGGCRECLAVRGFPFAGTAAVCYGAVLFRCGCFVILGRLRVAVRSGLGRVFFDGRSRERVW